jgi:protein involved in polysaccharide export with SLBB domain
MLLAKLIQIVNSVLLIQQLYALARQEVSTVELDSQVHRTSAMEVQQRLALAGGLLSMAREGQLTRKLILEQEASLVEEPKENLA